MVTWMFCMIKVANRRSHMQFLVGKLWLVLFLLQCGTALATAELSNVSFSHCLSKKSQCLVIKGPKMLQGKSTQLMTFSHAKIVLQETGSGGAIWSEEDASGFIDLKLQKVFWHTASKEAVTDLTNFKVKVY